MIYLSLLKTYTGPKYHQLYTFVFSCFTSPFRQLQVNLFYIAGKIPHKQHTVEQVQIDCVSHQNGSSKGQPTIKQNMSSAIMLIRCSTFSWNLVIMLLCCLYISFLSSSINTIFVLSILCIHILTA